MFFFYWGKKLNNNLKTTGHCGFHPTRRNNDVIYIWCCRFLSQSEDLPSVSGESSPFAVVSELVLCYFFFLTLTQTVKSYSAGRGECLNFVSVKSIRALKIQIQCVFKGDFISPSGRGFYVNTGFSDQM